MTVPGAGVGEVGSVVGVVPVDTVGDVISLPVSTFGSRVMHAAPATAPKMTDASRRTDVGEARRTDFGVCTMCTG